MGVLMSTNTKVELRKLFYSDLNETEIKRKLGLNQREYRQVLNEVKEELGLSTSYRRKPHRFGVYNENSYYIMRKDLRNNDFEILTYRPTLQSAKYELENIIDDNVGYEYIIEQANDNNMKTIIHDEYFNKKNNWEVIMQKCKLPYHKFYELLNALKVEANRKGEKTLRDNRFIYRYNPTNKYVIRKSIDGVYKNFGYYESIESAKEMRDYLETVDWNVELYKKYREQKNII